MKRLIYILLGLLCTACYDDKGSYDYHDICEVSIEGYGNREVVRGSLLQIDPIVTVTEGDTADLTRFAYEWRANIGYDSSVLIGTRRILKYQVELSSRDYSLYFRVTDRQTGVVTVAKSDLSVKDPLFTGILLAGENDRGEADVQMLSMVKDTVLYKDLLKNSGLPVLKDLVDVIHTGTAGNDNYKKLWVLTKSQAYSMDRETFTGSESKIFDRLLFLSRNYNTTFVPVDVIPRIKDKSGNTGSWNGNSRATVCNNGYIFSSYLGTMGGDYYIDPVNCLKDDPKTYFKAAPYLFYTLNNYNGFLWFDVENNRFLKVGSFDTSSSSMDDHEEDVFPWNQGKLQRTLVYGENTLDGGNSDGNSFTIMKDPSGQYYIYKFFAAAPLWGEGPTKRGCYTVTPIAVNFDKAEFFAFSSHRTVMYYAVGSMLYAYDYNQGNEKLYTFDMGDQITMLQFDTAIEPGVNPLYVATYNATTGGKLQKYTQGLNPDKVELNTDEKSSWTGLTKIKKMSWRAIK